MASIRRKPWAVSQGSFSSTRKAAIASEILRCKPGTDDDFVNTMMSAYSPHRALVDGKEVSREQIVCNAKDRLERGALASATADGSVASIAELVTSRRYRMCSACDVI